MSATPIYASLVNRTGIVPEKIYERATNLITFKYPPVARTKVQPPRVGQRPASRKRKGKR